MKPDKVVFLIIKLGKKPKWKPVGVGFNNKDGSINLKLDMYPNLDFQLRDPKEKP